MSIDKNGIIKPREEKKRYQLSVKDICLLVTTLISAFSLIIMLYEGNIQKLQYEKSIEELNLEKNKYENILKENDIQLKNSYIVCDVDYIKTLYNNLGKENNVKIISNDITKMFYDNKRKTYLNMNDIKKKDSELKEKYKYLVAEVIFLKIEAISNRIVKDVNFNFLKVETENDIEEEFTTFSYMKNKDYYKKCIFRPVSSACTEILIQSHGECDPSSRRLNRLRVTPDLSDVI